MKKLSEIAAGTFARIISFAKDASKCNFARFALTEGQIIKCVAKIGPVIIKENDQTIAVGKNLAEKIFVEEITDNGASKL